MKTICFYFQVHQPLRLKKYRFFNMGKDHNYLDDSTNRAIMKRVAQKCYLPMNALLLRLIKENNKQFKVTFSLTGLAVEQFRQYAPEVLDSFKALVKTGCVEILGETYAHSLSSLINEEEFEEQVKMHSAIIKEEFGVTPVTFRNTELIYSDRIGEMVYNLGFKTMLTEGAKHILGWKSPNFVYSNAIKPDLKLLLRNFKLSDDIAFRFSNREWDQWPLTADKYASWLTSGDIHGDVINLFMDYETFGEHQPESSGIFDFMAHLPAAILATDKLRFETPKEAAARLQPVAAFHTPYPISWADEERDVTAWLGNELQNEAFGSLYCLRDKIKAINHIDYNHSWRFLQCSDHFYYMATKWFSDSDVHNYFNPYDSPYDAFINYMNVISDFKREVENKYKLEVLNIDPQKPALGD